jgi:hypothetical protein
MILLFVYLIFFLTSSVIVDAVNATGLCCVRVYAVAALMINRGRGWEICFVQLTTGVNY